MMLHLPLPLRLTRFMIANAILLIALQAPVGRSIAAELQLERAPGNLTGLEVARRAEDALRSDRTFMKATMTIESPRLTQPRVVKFSSSDDRKNKRSLIRIGSPPKDAGTGFLKLDPNLWMYVPRVERTIRIPPSMMLQSWMGSDFTNDDLVKESSDLEDYDHVLLGIDPSGGIDSNAEGASAAARSAYVVEYTPHEDAPVVWGRIVAWIDIETGTPIRQDFYDEDGERLRAMSFGDVREIDGRHFPHSWRMVPLDKEGHETRLEIREIRFDVEFEEGLFTTRRLKSMR